jgi:hypothetical protein
MNQGGTTSAVKIELSATNLPARQKSGRNSAYWAHVKEHERLRAIDHTISVVEVAARFKLKEAASSNSADKSGSKISNEWISPKTL